MSSDTLADAEKSRIAQDEMFYKLQMKIQIAKLRKGIYVPNFDFGTRFDIFKRLDWLKTLKYQIEDRLKQSHETETRITANVLDFEEAKKFIYKEEENRHQLNLIKEKISAMFDDVIKSRKGIPFIPIIWDNYNKNKKRPDYELYFLGTSYQENCEFTRPEFQERDFERLVQIFKCFTSPDSLIEAYSNFLGLDSNKVVISSLNQRFNGFEIWALSGGSAYQALKNNTATEFLDFDNAFILKYANDDISKFLESDTFLDIDAWIDPISLEIFVNNKMFPLQINRKVEYQILSNIEYTNLVAFDYLLKPKLIPFSDIIEKISLISPSIIVDEIYALDNGRFILLPEDQSDIWTFASVVVFSLNPELTNGQNAYIYNADTDEFTKFASTPNFSYGDLIKMVSGTLDLLRIPGVELHSPDKLVEEYDNQLYS